MSCLLAIDQSTSATKALLLDCQGDVLDRESMPHQQHYPEPGWVEHDAEEIWQNLLKVVGQVCGRNGELVHQLAGVSIANQRETIVVFDRTTGQPLAPAIVWQCRRSDALCDELRHAGHEELIQSKTGLKLDAYFSASKLTWLVRNRPDLADRLQKGTALIGTMDAYLIYRLTDGQVFATDHTNASRTLLFDITTLTWDSTLCELFEVPVASLPEVRESFARFGETTFNSQLPSPVALCAVMGDSQASLFSQRCYSPGDTKATLGTGSSVLLNIGNTLRLPSNGAVAALAWVHQGVPCYAWEGLINYSAATIAWLKDQLGLISTAAESESVAAEVDDCGGVYVVPAFAGLSAPHWSPDARAAIVGITAFSGKSHIVRAALESIAYQLSDVLDMLQSSGVTPTVLNADGGPTQNSLLMQIIADITRLDVSASNAPESSALGAAMAGMLGLGIATSFEDLTNLPCSTQQYRPLLSESETNRLKAGWATAVQRVL